MVHLSRTGLRLLSSLWFTAVMHPCPLRIEEPKKCSGVLPVSRLGSSWTKSWQLGGDRGPAKVRTVFTSQWQSNLIGRFCSRGGRLSHRHSAPFSFSMRTIARTIKVAQTNAAVRSRQYLLYNKLLRLAKCPQFVCPEDM